MRGYFSRLIEQTDIGVSPVGDSELGVRGQSGTSREPQEGASAIHIEETELIEPQQAAAAGDDSDSSGEDSSGEDTRHLQEESRERRISQEPETRASERKVTERQQPDAYKGEAQPPSEYAEPHPAINEETIEVEAAGEGLSRPSPSVSKPADRGGKQEPILNAEAAKVEREISREQARQAYLRRVIEWVAETPVEYSQLDSQAVEKGMSKRVPGASAPGADGDESDVPARTLVRGARSGSQGEDGLSMDYPLKPTDTDRSETREIQDLHLTIGTISLTIEEPQKELQDNEPSQMEQRRKPIQENNIPRLNRYYIRQ
jgi:hypothetical protein